MKIRFIVNSIFLILGFAGCQVEMTGPCETQRVVRIEPTASPMDSEPFFDTIASPLEETAAEMPTIPSDVLTYLNHHFCDQGICGPDGRWQDVILVDGENPWRVAELEMLQFVLITTMQALDDIGADGYALLTGYRLHKIDEEFVFVTGDRQVVANVRHEEQEIDLSRSAFLRQQGFLIYHELGHVVDRRLGRRFSASYQAYAASHGAPTEALIANGYWLREYGRSTPGEAVADAFATWVVLHYAGTRCPIFPGTPVDIDYDAIADAVHEALVEAGAAEGK